MSSLSVCLVGLLSHDVTRTRTQTGTRTRYRTVAEAEAKAKELIKFHVCIHITRTHTGTHTPKCPHCGHWALHAAFAIERRDFLYLYEG